MTVSSGFIVAILHVVNNFRGGKLFGIAFYPAAARFCPTLGWNAKGVSKDAQIRDGVTGIRSLGANASNASRPMVTLELGRH
ncbi:MAG TPA: hypothetical protein VLT83_06615 [Opitutaceae bacterium]|nr:hypothetical protein [Opitutaceae bacterium]